MSLMSLWDDATEEELAQAIFLLAKKVSNIETVSLSRKICQLSWKLIQVWK